MDAIAFFREGLKNLKTVGTVTRSSSFLCKAMVEHAHLSGAHTIVELGAGDGVITRHILAAMAPEARLLAFEVNEKFCERLRAIADPRLTVAAASAEEMETHLRELGASQIDCVISAIPFVALPRPVAQHIVGDSHRLLRPGGRFVQVNYSLLMKPLYEEIFGEMEVNFVPLNVPPAFVLVGQKA